MRDGFSMTDRDGVHIAVNDALCSITGFERNELIGKRMPYPYWPEETYNIIQNIFHKTLKGDFSDYEVVFKRKNGERFPVFINTSCIKYNPYGQEYFFATIKDLSKIKVMETLLKESEQRYHTILEQLPVGLWEMDFSQVKKDVDDLRRRGITDFRRYFQENPDEMVRCINKPRVLSANKFSRDLSETSKKFINTDVWNEKVNTHKENFELRKENILRLIEGDYHVKRESSYSNLKGHIKHIYVECIVPPDSMETWDTVIIINTDITKIKKYQNMLTEQNKKLESW
jgi:PAS domain S-box-containing protein